MSQLAACLAAIRPGAEWTLIGDTIDGLTWLDPSDVPTQTEIDAWMAGSTVRALLSYAADKRWQVEVSGCRDPDGRPIATDRSSQSKLIAEMVAISAGLRADPSIWKLADGTFASLTNAQMLAVIVAVQTHIQSAFSVEAWVIDNVKAGAITTEAQIDASAWPTNL